MEGTGSYSIDDGESIKQWRDDVWFAEQITGTTCLADLLEGGRGIYRVGTFQYVSWSAASLRVDWGIFWSDYRAQVVKIWPEATKSFCGTFISRTKKSICNGRAGILAEQVTSVNVSTKVFRTELLQKLSLIYQEQFVNCMTSLC